MVGEAALDAVCRGSTASLTIQAAAVNFQQRADATSKSSPSSRTPQVYPPNPQRAHHSPGNSLHSIPVPPICPTQAALANNRIYIADRTDVVDPPVPPTDPGGGSVSDLYNPRPAI